MHVSAIPSLAAFERNVRCLTASLLQRPCHGACSTCVIQGACFASLPLLSRFGVGAGLTCSLCCLPPWGEELDKQLLQPLFGYSPSGSTLSFVIGILEIPSAKIVVFPPLSLLGLLVAACCKAVLNGGSCAPFTALLQEHLEGARSSIDSQHRAEHKGQMQGNAKRFESLSTPIACLLPVLCTAHGLAPGCKQFGAQVFEECCSLVQIGVGDDATNQLAPQAESMPRAFEKCKASRQLDLEQSGFVRMLQAFTRFPTIGQEFLF